MAEDKSEPRETNWRQLLPWTVLFQGFRVALDPNKLLLAAAGILAMACGWWLLAVIFYPGPKKEWPGDYLAKFGTAQKAWPQFQEDRQRWNLWHEVAGPATPALRVGPGDLATSPEELEKLQRIEGDVQSGQTLLPEVLTRLTAAKEITPEQARLWTALGKEKPAGKLRTWPWFEDRGPNPYLLVTGRARTTTLEPGQTVLNWFLTDQLPVLIEPLIKLFRPVIYFFDGRAGGLARFYFILVMVWTLAVWALFGGAISRIAAVQVTRQEKIGAIEALRFTLKRYTSLLTAPLFPLVLVALLVLVMIIFGAFHLIPMVGDIIVDGLFWPIVILLGLAMAVVLVGLVGWPMMAATISTEGTDTWEAVSRSYSYVFQAPWHYIFYTFMALVYGAVVVFFVGFMGSMTVYLAKWGVTQTPGAEWANRDPAYLFVQAPTSFHWRELLLQNSKAQLPGPDGVEFRPLTVGDRLDDDVLAKYTASFSWYNHVGTFLVSAWLYLVFLLIIGFGYSYFWTASTIIYLLMRRKVDDAELDEIYLEEEDQDLPYAPTPSPTPAPAPAPGGPALTMVDSPTLRTSPTPPPAPAPTPPASREESASTPAPRPQQAPLPPADRPSTPGDDGPKP